MRLHSRPILNILLTSCLRDRKNRFVRDVVDVAVMRNVVGGIFNNKPGRAGSRHLVSDVIVGEDSLRMHLYVVFNQMLPRDGLRLLIDIDGY